MTLSTTATRRLSNAIAVSAALAAITAPLAQGTGTPTVRFMTDHSASQNGNGRNAVPLITENSAGQNATGPTLPPFITEHSPAQSGNAQRSGAPSSPVTSLSPTGFDWGDAGIGAAVVLGLALVAAGAMLAIRKRHALAH